MSTLITVVHIITCVFLILVVLIQSGKGAEISASLGGSSQTVFGSSGGANFFTRFTAVMAAIFMCTSLVLTYLGTQTQRSVFENTVPPAATVPPAGIPQADAPAAGQPAQPAAPQGGNAAPAPDAAKPNR